MFDLNQIRNAYFIGIGGIGMSALARYFHTLGIKVSGYDRTETSLTRQLTAEGINVHYEDTISLIPDAVMNGNANDTLVIFTPAMPKDHLELNWFLHKGVTLYKRAEILGSITRHTFNIAVAGTHGKTTTSTLVAHLLRNAGVDCTAFLGGISANYNSNFLLGSKKSITVVEADEFDRSFLHLQPDLAIITSMDADHLDIYGTDDEVKMAFNAFAAGLKPGGMLVYHQGLPLDTSYDKITYRTYTTQGEAVYAARNARMENHTYSFDLVINGETRPELQALVLGVPGRHNMENAVAASAIALQAGLSPAQLRDGLSSFRGVKRRFEYIINRPDMVFIDDYAHHPAELQACITSVKQLYPGKKITGIFQPHLYSRTRDFLDGFAQSLSLLDELVLLDIYPAREQPIPGVTSQLILDKVTTKKTLCSKQELVQFMQQKPRPEVLLTLGAGDIDTLVQPLKQMYTHEA